MKQASKKLTKTQENELSRNYKNASLTPLHMKFIDNYLSNGFKVGEAYHDALNKKNKVTKASRNNGSRLLRYQCVMDEIDARLEAQKITKDKINTKLWEVANMIYDPKTVNSAVTALATLAKIKGMITNVDVGDQFFQNNFLVYAPTINKDEEREVVKILEKNNLIE